MSGGAWLLQSSNTHFKQEVNFSQEVFFLFLLPPISECHSRSIP